MPKIYKQLQVQMFHTYLNLSLMKKYVFNIVKIVEIPTNTAKEIFKDSSDSAEKKKWPHWQWAMHLLPFIQ